MTATITLNIPGLFGPWQGYEQPGFSLPATPGLNTVLSYSAYSTRSKELQTADKSSADYSYFADFQAWPDQAVLNAEFVHLRADQRHVRAYGSELLSISPDESNALITSLNDFMTSDHLSLQTANAERWYLLLQDLSNVQFSPLLAVLGKPMDDYLPVGQAAGLWHRRLNEWQMLLYDHPVNQRRQDEKKLAINGIWLWGNNPLQPIFKQESDHLMTDDRALMGFYRQGVNSVRTLPECLEDILPLSRNTVIQLDWLTRPLAYQDEEKWSSALSDIEINWIAPALKALKNHSISRLMLLTDHNKQQHQFLLKPQSYWRFWRKAESLQSWINHE